jgi:hypothetical protein
MKKHRQKHASIRSIKKPGEQEGGAEERKEKSGKRSRRVKTDVEKIGKALPDDF